MSQESLVHEQGHSLLNEPRESGPWASLLFVQWAKKALSMTKSTVSLLESGFKICTDLIPRTQMEW